MAVTNTNSTPVTQVAPETVPVTPREYYNAGTQKLHEGKLREAEAFLQSALAAQEERLQPPALYNLGHVRFAQGTEELMKSLAAGPTAASGRSASRHTDNVIRFADEAMAANDLEKMVSAYVRGRGIRKELRAAREAVRRAMETHGTALARWQRASGDFKSAVELKPSDTNSQHNAEVVDRSIARLVDSLREMQQLAQAMGEKQRELGEKLRQLRGRIPDPLAPPGAAGDEEEEEDFPTGPQPGQQEAATKEGEEMKLSPDQAAWLLDGFKLDGERRLPMGQGDTSQPKERSGRDW